MTDSEILFEKINGWGVITLNRPKALNALTLPMVKEMRACLNTWADDQTVHAVMIQGAGDRAFCAGGDIRWLHDTAKHSHADACAFFREEYTNNAAIFHFPKPYVALIDGITMGGGVGVSVHGDFRVVGDQTLFAMPETGIGLFPDVGGGYFMPRLAQGLGLYYALTGARANAADCMVAAIATHYVPTSGQVDLVEALQHLDFSDGDPYALVETCLNAHAAPSGEAPVHEHRTDISTVFDQAQSMDQILERLSALDTDFARETEKTLMRMSPTSLKLTLEQMHRGATLEFNEVMKMEFRIVTHIMKGHDFFEGVRALILDKDKSPKWSPNTLEGVGNDLLTTYSVPFEVEDLAL